MYGYFSLVDWQTTDEAPGEGGETRLVRGNIQVIYFINAYF